MDVPQGDATRGLSYEELVRELEQVPLTQLPSLLFKVIELCVQQQVFREGGLERMVARAKEKAETANGGSDRS